MSNFPEIYKYSKLNINKINISNLNDFYIQSPIFKNYELLVYNSDKFIEIKFDNNKISHIKFLKFINDLEIKLDNIKTEIITDIQDNKSLKIYLNSNTKFFNADKKEISKLNLNKISILFKLEFYKSYYSYIAIQILQIN